MTRMIQREILLCLAGIAIGVNLVAAGVVAWCDDNLQEQGISIAQILER